jgi:3D (Asp-Asp-Asp) domain-containing protein
MSQAAVKSTWKVLVATLTLATLMPVHTSLAAEVLSFSELKTALSLADDTQTPAFAGFDVPAVNGNEVATTTNASPDVKVVKSMKVDMTAYTSAVEECDDSPFITADGSVVRDGIVATNILPFGTKVRIPAYFGDKVFEVRDRMNPRYSYRMDLWVTTKQAAKTWGIKRNVTIEIVEMGDGKSNWSQWKGRGKDLARIGKYGPSEEDDVI